MRILLCLPALAVLAAAFATAPVSSSSGRLSDKAQKNIVSVKALLTHGPKSGAQPLTLAWGGASDSLTQIALKVPGDIPADYLAEIEDNSRRLRQIALHAAAREFAKTNPNVGNPFASAESPGEGDTWSKASGAFSTWNFNADERLQLAAVARDMTVKRRQAEQFTGDFAQPIEVEVHTRDATGAEVPNLEVHYRRAPDEIEKAKRFDLRSSPTTRPIRAGAYIFWAVAPGEHPRKGPETPIDVLGTGTKSVDISAP